MLNIHQKFKQYVKEYIDNVNWDEIYHKMYDENKYCAFQLNELVNMSIYYCEYHKTNLTPHLVTSLYFFLDLIEKKTITTYQILYLINKCHEIVYENERNNDSPPSTYKQMYS